MACNSLTARLLLHGIVLLVILVMTTTARAQSVPEDAEEVADEVVSTLSPAGWPIGGALGQRIYCIEGIESTHGRWMFNPTPWAGEHAQGWLGWLPTTAASVGVRIGDRVSEWQGAALMLARGRGREFHGIAAGIC